MCLEYVIQSVAWLAFSTHSLSLVLCADERNATDAFKCEFIYLCVQSMVD